MKKIILFIFTFVCLISHLVYPQTVSVFDKITLKPIEGVMITDGKSTVKTDIKGQADISIFKGVESIKFQALGFVDQYYSYALLERNNFVVTLDEKSYVIDEIIISADRFYEKLKDIPGQVELLNAKEMEFKNVQTTADLLQKTGAVFVQRSQMGGGSPILRGFEANKVLLVLDGIRMNNAIYRGGHLQNILRVDNNMLDRAEVIFGAGSLMYGSDALGGVMSFYTKNPVFSNTDRPLIKGGAMTRFSSVNLEKTGHLDFSIGFKNIAFLTSFTFSDFDDLVMGKNLIGDDAWLRRYYTERINGVDTMLLNDDMFKQKPTGYYQYNFLQKIMFKQSENVMHTLNFYFTRTGDVPRYDRLNTLGSNQKFTNAEWYYGPEEWLLGAYKFEISNKEKSFFDNLQVTAGYQRVKESRHNRKFGSSNKTNQYEKVDVLTLNADFKKNIKEHELRYGIEGTYNYVTSTANRLNINTGVESYATTRYPDGGSNMKSLAAYISHSWELSKYFVLSDGVRFNYVTLDATINDTVLKFPFKDLEVRNAAINGNLGLVFTPGEDWRIYLNGSTGFRAPNVDDMSKINESVKGTATQIGNVVVPNPDLKPEYTFNGEFGISKIFMNSIKLEGIAFATYFKDAIVKGPFKFNGQDTIIWDGFPAVVTANVNSENGAYILGYNLNLSADLTDYFSIISTVTFTYGRIKTDSTDSPLDHIPPVYGQTDFIVKANKFKLDFWIAYNGWKHVWDYNMLGEDNFRDATPDGMPAWYTLNLSAIYQINKYLQIQAGVENILDKNYRVFASGITAPGRNFIISLRSSF